MDCSQVASAGGKDDLGGGTLVGITLKLLNWKLKFADKGSATVCTISGGNLVAVNEYGDSMSPIEPSTNVTVMLAQSSSATLSQDADIDAIKAKTDLLPSDVATPTSVWNNVDRRITSLDVDSGEPGQHLPSKTQVSTHDVDIKTLVAAIKAGRGFVT